MLTDESLSPRQLAEYIYQSYQLQDFSRFDEIMTEDCSWIIPGNKELLPWAGEFVHMEMLDFLNIIKEHLDFEYFTPLRYHVDGETVIAEVEEKFTVINTGQTVVNKLVAIFETKQGKLKKYTEYSDTGLLERAVNA
ncbi:nuclear transport factor 2 family protein [Rubritalea marina]|uniref:nuclear transport factor 2 family protein n=1 Tax=Rubritalea marina TaxID=361055 RepID=UPI00035CE6E3|nr:nuclear transport factor 2 family protein [Rubritalea marina]